MLSIANAYKNQQVTAKFAIDIQNQMNAFISEGIGLLEVFGYF